MKVKKLLGAALISIPLYFLAPNVAKAEEFKINLKNPEVKVEQTNIFNDLDWEGFLLRARDRVEQRVYEESFLLDVSPETASFLFNWERATIHMNDIEKKIYMDKVNKDMEKIIGKAGEKQAEKEFKESKFFEYLQDELNYYKRWARENITGKIKIREKKAYVDEIGGINFKYKKEEFKGVPEGEKFKLKFKGDKVSVGRKDFFEFNLKIKPVSFHKRNYNPKVEAEIMTKYISVRTKVEYDFMEEKLKNRLWTTLPEGIALSVDYDRETKKGDNTFSTTLSKRIKDYNVHLSYTKTDTVNPDKTHSKNDTIWLLIQKTW